MREDVRKAATKDAIIGGITGGLAPVAGIAGDAAAAGLEGAGGAFADAATSASISSVGKESASAAVDKSRGKKVNLATRAKNALMGTGINTLIGGGDESDGLSSDDSGYIKELNDSDELASDAAYQGSGETIGDTFEKSDPARIQPVINKEIDGENSGSDPEDFSFDEVYGGPSDDIQMQNNPNPSAEMGKNMSERNESEAQASLPNSSFYGAAMARLKTKKYADHIRQKVSERKKVEKEEEEGE